MKFMRFVGGLLLGALVGGAVGMFLAPEAGGEFQSTIRARIDNVVEEGRRAAAERRAELEAQFAQAKRAEKSA